MNNPEGIGAVLADMDGTLLIPKRRLPTPEVQAAARQLREYGVPLLSVTGRSYSLFRRLAAPLDLRDNLCTLDGGATVAYADSGEVLWSQWLTPAATRRVIAV